VIVVCVYFILFDWPFFKNKYFLKSGLIKNNGSFGKKIFLK